VTVIVTPARIEVLVPGSPSSLQRQAEQGMVPGGGYSGEGVLSPACWEQQVRVRKIPV
jgi:hypothetical protein